MVLEPDYETILREELEQLQVERLQSTLYRVYRYVSFYKHSFDEHGVNIESIKSVQDLGRLPFTTKEDLRRSYPYDMFAVPLRDIVRIHSTSGTTGKPIIVGYTKNDLRHWTSCTARLLAAAGVEDHDVVQIAFPFNLFTGGFGFHQGAEHIGASVIPSSTSVAEKQIMIMKDFKTTVLICAPSMAVTTASTLRELHIHAESLSLRVGLFGAEPWSEKLRSQLEAGLHITALDNYGLTEVIGPGVAGECEHKQGLHINEDHFIVEVVDPNSLEPLPSGSEGELVFTTITKEGFPLIRYRTGDISALVEEPCACGRTTRRMRRVTGRTDDLIFIKGQKVFPSQVEEILLEAEGTAPHYRIILDRQDGEDTMEIRVEILESFPAFDELKNLERLRDTITRRIEVVLGVEAKVTLVEPRSLLREQDGGAKARRVEDRRAG
jgi:phenylacetate-CoA ligase